MGGIAERQLDPAPQRARANRKGCASAGGEGFAQDPEALLAGPGVPVVAGALDLLAAGGVDPSALRARRLLLRLPLGRAAAAVPPLPQPWLRGPRDAGPHRVSPPAGAFGRLRRLAHPAAAYQHAAARRGHQPALQRLQVPRPPEEQGNCTTWR